MLWKYGFTLGFEIRGNVKVQNIVLQNLVRYINIYKRQHFKLCYILNLKNTNLIHLLIGKYRAGINPRSRGGYTPLMLAAIHQRLVKLQLHILQLNGIYSFHSALLIHNNFKRYLMSGKMHAKSW